MYQHQKRNNSLLIMKTFPKISILLLIAFLLSSTLVYAQGSSEIVRGKVTSSGDNEPLISVTIMEVDPSNRFISGTVSNYDGEYVLQVKITQNNPKSVHAMRRLPDPLLPLYAK